MRQAAYADSRHIQESLSVVNVSMSVIQVLNSIVLLYSRELLNCGGILLDSYEELTKTAQQSRLAILLT